MRDPHYFNFKTHYQIIFSMEPPFHIDSLITIYAINELILVMAENLIVWSWSIGHSHKLNLTFSNFCGFDSFCAHCKYHRWALAD